MRNQKNRRIGLFGGTTEGRILADSLSRAAERLSEEEGSLFIDVFVATEYGGDGLIKGSRTRIFRGRMDEDEITETLEKNRYDLIIDATHPYARLVSENIEKACGKTGTRRIRVLRDGRYDDPAQENSGERRELSTMYADSVEEAVGFLKETRGAVLVTTGSRELHKYKKLPGWEQRIYARVLSIPQVVSQCAEMGFCGAHLFAMQGPFSAEMNLALLRAVDARWLVTKESGDAGGFEEKRQAALEAGVGLIVIRRPREAGLSMKEAKEVLEQEFGVSILIPEEEPSADSGRTVWLVGTGPGSQELLTGEAKQAFKDCQLIVGAKRLTDGLCSFGKPVFSEYQAVRIRDYLREHPKYRKVAVALSGDTGFYSGAGKLFIELKKEPQTEVKILPGISSLNYFFSRIGESWENVKLLSLHGRDGNLVGAVRENERVFALTGGFWTVGKICRELAEAGLGDAVVTVGENLSGETEKIFSKTAQEMEPRDAFGLAVVLIRNDRAKEKILSHGLPDEAFLRGNTPMTKMEVRTVSLARLQLTGQAVVYDVGAGTGSVSVECARLSEKIRVYAIEENPEALELLEKNRRKFGLFNMEIIPGTAPEAMEGLPAPTHVFIGGSRGKMGQIIEAALRRNPEARFVANVITPESMAAVLAAAKALEVTEPEIVQITAARSKKAGGSHLMTGLNPVWIISFAGKGRKQEKGENGDGR